MIESVNGRDTIEIAVLLCTGAYSPSESRLIRNSHLPLTIYIPWFGVQLVHKMHVQMMDLAKQFIETKLGVPVVAGFLSPSTDSYVKGKLKKDFISAVHRYERVTRISSI